MAKYWYAGESAHGSESSMGFANDWNIWVFSSKKARDSWVEASRNLSARTFKRCEVISRLRQATMNGNGLYEPKPFTEEHWGIVPLYGWEIYYPGMIGSVDIVGRNTDEEIAPFYGRKYHG